MIENLSPISQRLVISTAGISLATLAITTSFHPLFSILVPLLTFFVIATALNEYYNLTKTKGLNPQRKIGLFITLISILTTFLTVQSPIADTIPITTLAIGLVITFLSYFDQGKNPLLNIAITLFGILYLVIPLSLLISINYFFPINGAQDGRYWLLYLITITYITDSAGLIFGKAFGRRALAPYISPKKTWAGAIGALAGAVVVSLLFSVFSELALIPINLNPLQALFLGGFLSVLAQIGDLAESLLKRDAGVKDSSSIPGMGGMLDIVDSLIFTTPFLYIYLIYLKTNSI